MAEPRQRAARRNVLSALARARREPEPAVLALIVGVVFGVLLAVVVGNDKPSIASGSSPARAAHHGSSGTARPSAPAPDHLRARLAGALRDGVRLADAEGGLAEAAVWVEGWSSPLEAGEVDQPSRLWSMSKPVTAVATLQAARNQVSPDVRRAMEDAITRSDNCAQRRVILELQRLDGGIAAAIRGFDLTLFEAGVAPPRPAPEAGGISSEPECTAYLEANAAGLRDPLGPALLLGVPEWNVDGAVHFAHALAHREYGQAGEEVLGLMRLPKQRSLEGVPQDMTAPLDWGAGAAFPGWQPAYKGGWGGSRQGAYVAGQIVVLTVGGTRVALAAMFHPSTQPPSDNPGATPAPKALADIFASVRRPLRALQSR